MMYTCCLLSRPSISKRASLAAREERKSPFSRMVTMQWQPSSQALGIAAPASERACEVFVALADTALKVIVTATTAKAAGEASLRRVPVQSKVGPREAWRLKAQAWLQEASRRDDCVPRSQGCHAAVIQTSDRAFSLLLKIALVHPGGVTLPIANELSVAPV